MHAYFTALPTAQARSLDSIWAQMKPELFLCDDLDTTGI